MDDTHLLATTWKENDYRAMEREDDVVRLSWKSTSDTAQEAYGAGTYMTILKHPSGVDLKIVSTDTKNTEPLEYRRFSTLIDAMFFAEKVNRYYVKLFMAKWLIDG